MPSDFILDICWQIEAIGNRVQQADPALNLKANRDISDLFDQFAPGSALLKSLPVKNRGGDKREKSPRDSDDDDEESTGFVDEEDIDDGDQGTELAAYECEADDLMADDQNEDHESESSGFDETSVLGFLEDIHRDIVAKQQVDAMPMPHGLGGHATFTPTSSRGGDQASRRRAFQGHHSGRPHGWWKDAVDLAGDPCLARPGARSMSDRRSVQLCSSVDERDCGMVSPGMSPSVEGFSELTETQMRALHLDNPAVSAAEFFKYDVLVVSYHFLVYEFARPRKFVADLKKYGAGHLQTAPKRPNGSLTSAIWTSKHARPWGKVIAFDEAHTIKNLSSRSYQAARTIRKRFETCVMITGTPIDNTWKDTFGFLFSLRGHPFTTAGHMTNAFVAPYDRVPGQRARLEPRHEFLNRYTQLMDAVTLRRPVQEISGNWQPAVEHHVQFQLSQDIQEASNSEFKKYFRSLAILRKKKNPHAKADWGSLVRAHQYVCHPSLMSIMEKLQRAAAQEAYNKYVAENLVPEEAMADDGGHLTARQKEVVEDWRWGLREKRQWRSPRVDCILDQLNQIRDVWPDDKVIIFDESVFFLEILAVMMEETDDPIPFRRFDSRQTSAERHVTLGLFQEMLGFAVLLCTRGTGGQGLNMQMANHVVLCSPWWNNAWVSQAIARVHRVGQSKTVHVYHIMGMDIAVEKHKERCCVTKERFNIKAIEEIERSDSEKDVQHRKLDLEP